VKPPIAPISNEHVRLRLLDEADLPLTLAWRNRDDVRTWFFSSQPISPDVHGTWFQRYQADPSDLTFIIEDRTVQRAVGQVSLYRIDRDNASAEFGRLMIGDPAARGRGIGLAATQLALEVAFRTLTLHRIHLEVLASNDRAIAIYRACGFGEIERVGDVVKMDIDETRWTQAMERR
jgi:RimJ/RimL family protein N-acetyltransferase